MAALLKVENDRAEILRRQIHLLRGDEWNVVVIAERCRRWDYAFSSISHVYADLAGGASSANLRHGATGMSMNVREAFPHYAENSGFQILRGAAKIIGEPALALEW